MKTKAPNTLGAMLDRMARDGMNSDGATMHAASDYSVQSRAAALDVQNNASPRKLAKSDALLIKVAAELMQTETARQMLDLVERTAAMHADAPRASARSIVFASFRRVLRLEE